MFCKLASTLHEYKIKSLLSLIKITFFPQVQSAPLCNFLALPNSIHRHSPICAIAPTTLSISVMKSRSFSSVRCDWWILDKRRPVMEPNKHHKFINYHQIIDVYCYYPLILLLFNCWKLKVYKFWCIITIKCTGISQSLNTNVTNWSLSI